MSEQSDVWDMMTIAFPSNVVSDDNTLPMEITRLEKDMIERAMLYHDQNRTRAAKDLGISRENLIYKLKKYKLNY